MPHNVLHFATQCDKIVESHMPCGIRTLGPKEVERLESSQNFPAYYTVLCARTADAIDAIDQQRYQEARALLVAGMQEAEEIILSQEE
jgi:hypothetical protein